MLSIRPKWCAKIIIGRKTMELRKSVPKLEVPFKCYIYCTSGHPYISVKGGNLDRDTVRTNTVGRCNGKVIGEFVCDYILQRCEMANADIAEQQSCDSREDIYFKYSEEYFVKFLKENADNIKAEYFIPLLVNDLIQTGKASVTVLDTRSKWFGVTYAADRQSVVDKIHALIAAGEYPEKLF